MGNISEQPQRARAGRFTTGMKRRFIDTLCHTGNVSEACRIAGVARPTAYEHRKTDEEFREAWGMALEEAADLLEAEARRRAVDGVERPIYQGGELVGTERQYSDQLLIRLLEAHKPEKYRHRQETQVVDDPLQNILEHIDGQSAAPTSEGEEKG